MNASRCLATTACMLHSDRSTCSHSSMLQIKPQSSGGEEYGATCRSRKQLIRALLMIICQLLLLGRAKARPLLPEQASSFEEREHIPVRSGAQVESTDMASETDQDFFYTSAQIGSRPPSCQNKCNACNPCLAIQVPTSQDRRAGQDPTPAGAEQIMGEFANYKPEGWKCKCGTRFFNP